MAGGGHSSVQDAREKLVQKQDIGAEPSHSTPLIFQQYDLPLPGTMPSTSRVEKIPDVVDPNRNDYRARQEDVSGSSKGATTVGSTPVGVNGVPPPGLPTPDLLTSQRPLMPSAGGSTVVAPMEIQEALLPPQPAVPFEHPISLPRRRWMVFMFCLVAALLFADQNLLAPNLTAAANYFGMSERQKDTLLGGALMAAFFAVGAPAALLVGWLADRGDINRRTLLFWVVVVGETPCLLTYWVKSFWQFFLLRALTGVAVGGCFPLVFSLLGDLVPTGRRAGVSAVVQIATGIGLAAGQALSGSIGPATNWRVPFVVVAAPSLGVALMMLLTTVEPPRGAFEEALRERYAEGMGSYEGSISWSKVVVLLRCPSNVLVIGQGLPGSLPWGMVLTYFNDFLAQQKGFTVQAATVVLLFFAGGGALGVIGGGAGGQWLYNKRKEYQALLAGGSVLAGIGPLYAIINADLQRIGLAATCFLAALGGAVASVAGPNLRSVMLNVNEPETRGVALALQSMTDDLGKGLGPVLVAGLIHALGRKGAFNVATGGWIPCGVMLASLAGFMRADEAAMQARLARSSDAQAAFRKEERRLAKVRLLAAADGLVYGSSDAGSGGSSSGQVAAPLPLSSSASEYVDAPIGEGARWDRGGFGASAGGRGLNGVGFVARSFLGGRGSSSTAATAAVEIGTATSAAAAGGPSPPSPSAPLSAAVPGAITPTVTVMAATTLGPAPLYDVPPQPYSPYVPPYSYTYAHSGEGAVIHGPVGQYVADAAGKVDTLGPAALPAAVAAATAATIPDAGFGLTRSSGNEDPSGGSGWRNCELGEGDVERGEGVVAYVRGGFAASPQVLTHGSVGGGPLDRNGGGDGDGAAVGTEGRERANDLREGLAGKGSGDAAAACCTAGGVLEQRGSGQVIGLGPWWRGNDGNGAGGGTPAADAAGLVGAAAIPLGPGIFREG
ncbi:hypothetical protein Vretimale_18101 [Volvox reticuliferus]|uniref:Uncharacterized protein n=1 Tax=Volvox reticuliferus TaxID=1737510 RepID=A0A8J4D082_9CHLO|nr:hypothetical protein Vretifemale_17745 [Volvox reticuliferus]GIM15233.1 hypothetical protein Vretimale_18101 [Volvox reticuliferus]